MAYCDTGRSLKTARAVLKVLRLMAERHDGISVDDVATHLGKSRSTAAYLLNSLVEEGFAIRDVIVGHGRYRLGPSRPEWVGAAAPPRPGVARELPPSVLAGRLQ
ncbi:MAG: helix-turn-helix domain-containing protein, partial [Acidimicrobiales bacterium]